MVLVDTSVWIRSLAGRAPFADEMDRLLEMDAVFRHELVYGELLIGDRGGRVKFLSEYECLHLSDMVPHGDVVRFARERSLHGRGAGWIDIHLLASAMVGHLLLWTADARLDALAREFDVSYESRRAQA